MLAPTFTSETHPAETTTYHTIALPDPASAFWKETLSGFTQLLALTNAGDDRIFIVEQRGLIWAVGWGQEKPVRILFNFSIINLPYSPGHFTFMAL